MNYVLTQVDSEDVIIEKTTFESIPTLREFSSIAYYVDRLDIKSAYDEIVSSLGDWVYVSATNEDGDCCQYSVDEGVYFLLEEVTL